MPHAGGGLYFRCCFEHPPGCRDFNLWIEAHAFETSNRVVAGRLTSQCALEFLHALKQEPGECFLVFVKPKQGGVRRPLQRGQRRPRLGSVLRARLEVARLVRRLPSRGGLW
jgi:hypothetical protein